MSSAGFKLYGIFGFPLSHTLSPAMQEAAFRAVGLKAFYLPFEMRPADFRRLMRRIRNLNLDGFNVTVPFKETVLPYLDGLNPPARAIGAVNTVVREGGRWIGFNTDHSGFLRSLEKDAKFQARGKKILILGAGGSARAMAYALARGGARKIVMANRTPGRAQKIILRYRRLFPRTEFVGAPLSSLPARGGPAFGGPPRNDDLALQPVDLVVNATSVGLKPKDPLLIDTRRFPKRTLFVDLIYRPAETSLLREAKKSGHRTLNGAGMLVYQGAEAFRLWTGKRVPVAVMKQTVGAGLKPAPPHNR